MKNDVNFIYDTRCSKFWWFLNTYKFFLHNFNFYKDSTIPTIPLLFSINDVAILTSFTISAIFIFYRKHSLCVEIISYLNEIIKITIMPINLCYSLNYDRLSLRCISESRNLAWENVWRMENSSVQSDNDKWTILLRGFSSEKIRETAAPEIKIFFLPVIHDL